MIQPEKSILEYLRRQTEFLGNPRPEEFVLPDYDGYGLVNVPATVLHHFGVPNVATPPLHPSVIGDALRRVAGTI